MPRHLDPGRPCACTSKKSFADCCRPYLRGEREAPSAVALMRSRFSAFALQYVDYLWRTLHASHAERQRPEADVLRQLRRACKTFDYRALTILGETPPDADGVSTVTFCAELTEAGQARSFTERSSFRHDGTGWRYAAGEVGPVG